MEAAVIIRMTKEERGQLHAQASDEGMSLQRYARIRLGLPPKRRQQDGDRTDDLDSDADDRDPVIGPVMLDGTRATYPEMEWTTPESLDAFDSMELRLDEEDYNSVVETHLPLRTIVRATARWREL